MFSAPLMAVRQHARVEAALQRMHEMKIRHLPVIDDKKNIIGILSDRDLIRAEPHSLVTDYMSTPVETITTDTTLRTVAQRMIDEKISSFLVLKNKDVVGIVTHEDILKAYIHMAEKPETIKDILKSAENLAYNSPIGYVIQVLNQMGV